MPDYRKGLKPKLLSPAFPHPSSIKVRLGRVRLEFIICFTNYCRLELAFFGLEFFGPAVPSRNEGEIEKVTWLPRSVATLCQKIRIFAEKPSLSRLERMQPYKVCLAFCLHRSGQNPDVYCTVHSCICSKRDRLSFSSEIQTIFGTVHADNTKYSI